MWGASVSRTTPNRCHIPIQLAGRAGHNELRKRVTMEPCTTVFVVDDDASVRKGLVRLLRSAGYHAESLPGRR